MTCTRPPKWASSRCWSRSPRQLTSPSAPGALDHPPSSGPSRTLPGGAGRPPWTWAPRLHHRTHDALRARVLGAPLPPRHTPSASAQTSSAPLLKRDAFPPFYRSRWTSGPLSQLRPASPPAPRNFTPGSSDQHLVVARFGIALLSCPLVSIYPTALLVPPCPALPCCCRCPAAHRPPPRCSVRSSPRRLSRS
jgi:hypothetical protein